MNWSTPGLPKAASVGKKNLPAMLGDSDSIPRSGRSPGEGNGNPVQYSHLGNPLERGVWWSIVRRVTELDTTE